VGVASAFQGFFEHLFDLGRVLLGQPLFVETFVVIIRVDADDDLGMRRFGNAAVDPGRR
jgi:hypothetical protein